MNNTERNEKMSYRLYILFKGGRWMQPGIVDVLIKTVTRDAELEDLGFGNAYNMPVYLLEGIEDHEDNAMVIAWDWDGENPHPRVLVGREEITPLIEALNDNLEGDSWDIAVEVNKKLRAE